MQNWLHDEIFSRLADQASFLVGEHQHALVLSSGGYAPAASQLAKQVTAIDAAALSQQTPGPHYDLVFLHLLSNNPDEQLLIWQQLSCLVKNTAALFFSAWSIDTFREWRDRLPIEFQDMHNIGDGLAQAGWADAVMSSQKWQVSYKDEAALKNDAAIVGVVPEADPQVPETITYEIAFGHAVFSRKLRSRQLGEYEVSIDGL